MRQITYGCLEVIRNLRFRHSFIFVIVQTVREPSSLIFSCGLSGVVYVRTRSETIGEILMPPVRLHTGTSSCDAFRSPNFKIVTKSFRNTDCTTLELPILCGTPIAKGSTSCFLCPCWAQWSCGIHSDSLPARSRNC